MDAIKIGNRIRTAREAKHLTQEYLAELTGLSPNHISVIERGIKLPRLETFVRIANVLDVSADFLLADVVNRSTAGAASELGTRIEALPRSEQEKVLAIIRILTEK